MKKTVPYIDLTNPERYNDVINFAKGITVEKAQELNQLFGCVKQIDEFKINLNVLGFFELEDVYGNTLYIAKYNKKDEVFKLINSNDFQLCSSLEEFDNIIRTTFKRKLNQRE